MKSSKFIRLLAALVCVVMAFVSCSGDAANLDPANDTVKPLAESAPLLDDASAGAAATTVYNSLNSLIEYKYKTPAYFKEALKIEGEILEYVECPSAFVMRTSEITAANLVKEVYSVYSLKDGSKILELENFYEYNYDVKASELEIYFENFGGEDNFYGVTGSVIVVKRTTNTPLTEEEIAGNFRFDKSEVNYKSETTYSFYDMKGQFFASTNLSGGVYAHSVESYATPFCLEIAGIAYYLSFDSEFVRAEDENDAGIGYYNFERGNYGYKISWEYELIQVFDKTTEELVAQYDIGEVDTLTVLDDGTILVQNIDVLDDDGAEYDFAKEIWNESTERIELRKCNLETYLINALTGEKTEIEFGYVFETIYAKTDLDVVSKISSGRVPYVVNFKDTIINYASARKIVDKHLGDQVMLFVDNGLGVNFVQSPGVIEGKPLLARNNFTLLSNGSALYQTAEGYQIIVDKDGKETALPTNALVRDPFILTEDAVYDLNLERIVYRDNYGYDYDIYDDDISRERKLEYVATVGDWGLFSSFERFVEEYDEDGDPIYEFETRYYRIYKVSNNNSNGSAAGYNVERIYNDVEEFFEATKDYVIFVNEDGKYVLYNSKLEHVFTSESEINVIQGESQIWFGTYSTYEGKPLVFKLN